MINKVQTDRHADQQRQLRQALADARRRNNKKDEALVLRWLDDLFVSRAHLRAEDREIVRLRRWLEAA